MIKLGSSDAMQTKKVDLILPVSTPKALKGPLKGTDVIYHRAHLRIFTQGYPPLHGALQLKTNDRN